MLISDDYKTLNEKLHQSHRYGERGDKWAEEVRRLIGIYDPATILDYGCGKGALKRAIAPDTRAEVREYDPAIPGKDALPDPADLVVSTDVLEHVEPDCIEEVVAHLKALAGKALFVVVSTRPAAKHLEDGRNAHLIVRPLQDWLPLLSAGMTVVEHRVTGKDFAMLLTPAG